MPLPEIKPLSKADSDSLIFKAAEFLNRSNSAAMGLVSQTLSGGDPVEAIGQSLLGKEVYGGQDVMSALFGGSPDTKVNRRVGLALDILNPLDPLNYVGVGALTKPGKLAKLAKGMEGATQLAQGAAAQTRAGQRGLLTFAGQRVPLPGDAAVLGKVEQVGRAVKESSAGRGIQKLFGGREGYVRSQMAPALKAMGINSQRDLETVLAAHSRAATAAETYKNATQGFIDTVKAELTKKEYADFTTQFLDQATKGPDALMQDAVRFIGSGSRAANRRRAIEAAQGFFEAHGREARRLLGEEGIGGMASTQVGYVPRVLYPDKDVDARRLARHFGTQKTAEVTKLEGLADNTFNRSLIPGSEEPISRVTLTRQGQLEFDRLSAADKADEAGYFERLRRNDPKAYAEWHQKYRLPLAELDEIARGEALGRYELQPHALFRNMQEQTAGKIRITKLVEELSAARTVDDKPLVRPWADLKPDEYKSGDWVMVSQGKWRDNPLAVPKIFDEALTKFNEVYMPGPDKPLFGELMQAILPKALQNAGLMSWWKGLAIYGGGPTGYWSRNFASGVSKNWLEGIGPTNAPRYYGEAFRLIGQSINRGGPLRRLLDIDETAAKFTGNYVARTGEEIPNNILMGQYFARRMHGGGAGRLGQEEVLAAVEAINNPNLSSRARERVFGQLHKGNFRVEMGVRIPVMLKTIDDTLEVARKAGIPVPQGEAAILKSLDTPGSVWDVAMTNAREAVIRSHFDYEDLTPFERKIRARWIPFYTWMRNNIPHETINMIQQPGKYMPYARAYYNAFEQQEMSPEDLPQWAWRSFAMPISPGEGDRARWLDWTSFLPVMDVAELGTTGAVATGLAKPEHGSTRAAEILRYLLVRSNPFITQGVEQAAQKNIFTRRAFTGDMPADVAGLTVGQPTRNALNMFRPVMEIDRLNPFGIFGATPRPHRNEPGGAERLMRTLTGVKTYATDQDEASMSYRRVQREIQSLRRAEQRELRDGNVDGARFIRDRRERLQKGNR